MSFVRTVEKAILKIKISNQHIKTLFRNMLHNKVTWIITTHQIIISVNWIINLGVSLHLREMIKQRKVSVVAIVVTKAKFKDVNYMTKITQSKVKRKKFQSTKLNVLPAFIGNKR